jgi:hypothetical protein
MAQACWHASADGRYFIDVAIGGYQVRVMVDSGLVDPLDLVGFELEPAIYDQLNQSGCLTNNRARLSRNAGGSYTRRASGLGSAQLVDPLSGKGIGPMVQVYASRGSPGLPNRVGLVFFHRLKGCRIIWDLDTRTWCVEYP